MRTSSILRPRHPLPYVRVQSIQVRGNQKFHSKCDDKLLAPNADRVQDAMMNVK
jgi:hypothetical protein